MEVVAQGREEPDFRRELEEAFSGLRRSLVEGSAAERAPLLQQLEDAYGELLEQHEELPDEIVAASDWQVIFTLATAEFTAQEGKQALQLLCELGMADTTVQRQLCTWMESNKRTDRLRERLLDCLLDEDEKDTWSGIPYYFERVCQRSSESSWERLCDAVRDLPEPFEEQKERFFSYEQRVARRNDPLKARGRHETVRAVIESLWSVGKPAADGIFSGLSPVPLPPMVSEEALSKALLEKPKRPEELIEKWLGEGARCVSFGVDHYQDGAIFRALQVFYAVNGLTHLALPIPRAVWQDFASALASEAAFGAWFESLDARKVELSLHHFLGKVWEESETFSMLQVLHQRRQLLPIQEGSDGGGGQVAQLVAEGDSRVLLFDEQANMRRREDASGPTAVSSLLDTTEEGVVRSLWFRRESDLTWGDTGIDNPLKEAVARTALPKGEYLGGEVANTPLAQCELQLGGRTVGECWDGLIVFRDEDQDGGDDDSSESGGVPSGSGRREPVPV